MAKKDQSTAFFKDKFKQTSVFLDFSEVSFGWKLTPKSGQNFMFNQVTTAS